MKNVLLLVLIGLGFFPSLVCANSDSLPGGRAITGLYSVVQNYQLKHPNTVPSFDELVKQMDPMWLERRLPEFIWLDAPIAFRDGTIQAITAYPILEDRKEDVGRYALYFNNKNVVDAIWAEEGELQRAFAAAAQAPLAGKLYVQPVTMWDKLPEYLKRMSDADRAAFRKKMKDRYQLSITDDGKIASPSTADAAAIAPTPAIPPVTTQATSQAKPVEIPAPATTSAPTSPTKQPANLVWWIVGLIILAAGVVFVARKKKPRA